MSLVPLRNISVSIRRGTFRTHNTKKGEENTRFKKNRRLHRLAKITAFISALYACVASRKMVYFIPNEADMSFTDARSNILEILSGANSWPLHLC